MRSGLLDRRVSLQSPTLATNGDPTSMTWTTEATVWAQRLDPMGTERAMGGMVQSAEATQAYRIRHRADVDPTWRIVDGTETWDIVAATPGAKRGEETMILVRRLDPDDG